MSMYESSSLHIHEAVSAWFLGPQAENADLLQDLFAQAVADHVAARTSYHPEDGHFITNDVKESQVYKQTVENLKAKFAQLSKLLNDFSLPFYSPRYAAHMTFESSLPSIAGWLAGLLLNPNNGSFEAGPITTQLELQVGRDLCNMLGFKNEGDLQSWGHLTCDGTVANTEFIWAARNLKFYPMALREAMKPDGALHFISGTFMVSKCASSNQRHLFKSLSTWELLNLRSTEVLSIPDRLQRDYGITPKYMDDVMSKYVVQSTGLTGIESRWGIHESPKFLMSGTKHYSWLKGISLAGVGSDNLIDVPVDHNARIDVNALRHALDNCLNNQQAVYGVVAIIGSTEEGAVDPLAKIVQLREEYRARGLTFLIHADAAWGGYFASTLHDPPSDWAPSWPLAKEGEEVPDDEDYVHYIALKPHTVHQLQSLKDADSVTIDPHKSGYCPYPSGGLCYKDRRIRHLLTWSAPYIEHGKRGESIGVHGIEGSKPGAAAASVFMHHSVVGLHKRGHGGLLGAVSFTCARLAAHWATMSTESTSYVVVPFNKLRSEPHAEAVANEKDFIRERILGRPNKALIRDPDPEVMLELRSLGSDLNINAFICNFRLKGSVADPDEWVTNEDVTEANYLNRCIFDQLSPSDVGETPKDKPMFLSATVLRYEEHGDCLQQFKRRAGLETESKLDLFVLRNVVMSPFQAAADFVDKMALTFKSVLEENLKHVVARNTVTPQVHTFIMQGTDSLFLVYRPLFHKANGRQQLIIEVAVPNQKEWKSYLASRKAHPNAIFMLKTPEIKISDILEGRDISCTVYANDLGLNRITITGARIIKNRHLLSRWQDTDYHPSHTPFYLYGTPTQPHIDHALLKAPNAQFTAESIIFTSLTQPLPADKLQNGELLLYIDRPERSLQPFDADGDDLSRSFFYPSADFKVMICEDPFPAIAHGPGLANAGDHYPIIARGSIRLPLNVFTDAVHLNRQDFRDYERITGIHRSTSPARSYGKSTGEEEGGEMGWVGKTAFDAMVKERLDIRREEVYSRMNTESVDGWFGDGKDISRRPGRESNKDKEDDIRGSGLFDAPRVVEHGPKN